MDVRLFYFRNKKEGILLVLLFVNLTVILAIAAAILHFSDLTSDPKWERLCGHAMLFTLVPILIIPGVQALRLPLSAFLVVVLIWGVMGWMFFQTRLNRQHEEDNAMKEQGAWKCTQCGTYNQKLVIECEKCGQRKEK